MCRESSEPPPNPQPPPSRVHLIQWNTNGLIGHWQDFKHTIHTLQPDVICVQETHLKPQDPYTFNIFPYTFIRSDSKIPGPNRRGGIGTFIKHNIPHRALQLNTQSDIQAIEIHTQQQPITLVNCYFSPSLPHTTLSELTAILHNIHTPILLCGDFNAHHPLWEEARITNQTRGDILYDITHESQLVCLNTGDNTLPARFVPHQNTTPDATFASPTLARHTTWEVITETYFSDHRPIHITLQDTTAPHYTTPRWDLNRADWDSYTTDMELKARDTDIQTLTDIIIHTATDHIPQTKPQTLHQKAVPWWNPECQHATHERNRAQHRYERHRTQDTLHEYKRAKARVRKVIKQAKKDSWDKHINTFNRFTPLNTIWKLAKSFTTNRQTLNQARTITHNNTTITDPQQITDTFAEHYHNQATQLPSTIPLQDTEDIHNSPYNAPLTLLELNDAIKQGGNTSTGPDNIHYTFLKHLGPIARTHLLNSYNRCWNTNSYPGAWFHAHIIPIPEQNKDHTSLQNYRPISLTSCIHKTFERIIKQRLLHFTTARNIIAPIHSGFIPNRSTTDNLIRLTSDIRHAFLHRQTTAALFLDIKNAYDTLNTATLQTYLHKIGLRGHFAAYLSHYLTRRTFQVKHLRHLSHTKYPTTGLMQGSILSPLLFVLALNSQIQNTPAPTKIAIYADDIAIWTTHQHTNNALVHIQNTVNTLQTKLNKLNLHIAPQKTQCILFGTRVNTTNIRPLQINNTDIPFSSTAKFLGITLDSSLTFRQHIHDIATRSSKRMNILRALTTTEWGGDRATLTKLYCAIIRPIMEYASIIFENAAPTHLHKLDVIQNKALRTITAAYRTSPITALHTYNNTPPLRYRRTQHMLRYFHRIQHVHNHPATTLINARAGPRDALANRSRQKTTVEARIHQLLREFGITLPKTRPRPQLPPHWLDNAPKTHYLITQPKHTHTDTEIQQLFQEYLHTHNAKHIFYTDGSKHNTHTAAAAILHTGQQHVIAFKARLPDHTSIYTAELHAIYTAYLTIQHNRLTKNIIATDSKSAVRALSYIPTAPTHPIIHLILHIHSQLQPESKPELIWIPGHSGINGNERADREANSAINLNEILKISLSSSDFDATIRNRLDNYYEDIWTNTGTALRDIHPTLKPWTTNNLDCRQHERLITRLRIGHTILTHDYIMYKRPPPTCNTCNTRLTVGHILLRCRQYDTERTELTDFCTRHDIPFTKKTLLGDDYPDILTPLIHFLHTTRLSAAL